jgi:hypothetical protein
MSRGVTAWRIDVEIELRVTGECEAGELAREVLLASPHPAGLAPQ